MKKILFFIVMLSIVVLMSLSNQAFAQTPQSFKYQTVVRNNEGKALANTLISLRISILFSSPLGNAVYVETFQHATNEFGIASINIGKGTATQGVFAAINWAAGEYFIKTEVDITGAANYDFIGTSQLLSVPYALYAEKSGKSINDQDTSVTNELQNIVKTGNTITLSQNGGNFNLSEYLDNTDNQILSLTDPTHLTISNGNTIQLSAGLADLDADSTNELQNLTLNNDTLKLSKANQVVFPHDADRDSTNELQSLSHSNDTLFLSKGNFVVFPHDADRDSTNELQNLSVNHNKLFISKGNYVSIDADTINELQTLSLNHDTLSISKGNSVLLTNPINLPDGISDIIPIHFDSTYTVPQGKNLYIFVTPANNLIINGINVSGTAYASLTNPIIAASGDIVTCTNATLGFLVLKRISPITVNVLSGTPYIVPNGKILIITNIFMLSNYLLINDENILLGSYLSQQQDYKILNFPIILNAGDTVKMVSGGSFNGYLK